VLRQGIQGIAELITQPGLINVDFAHIRQVMQNGGGALMSIGIGEGENKAFKAIEQALHHPLLESISIENATGIIANFTGGSDLTFVEVMEALNHLQELTGNRADIIPGVISDARMDDRAQVILVITGLGAMPIEAAMPARKPQPVERPADPAARETNAAAQPAPAPAPPFERIIRPPSVAAQPNPLAQAVGQAQAEMTSTNSADLDLPAFLRRRAR
jgi:cell division protein FtsZ